MTEPLKPRIDFTGTLEQADREAFKTAQTFSGTQAENFAPALPDDPAVEEGPAEAVVEAALRPKRSVWRRMVTAGLANAGLGRTGRMCRRCADCWRGRGVCCDGVATSLASATARA